MNVELPTSTVRSIEEIVGEKGYDGVAQFVRVAAENQIELENGDTQTVTVEAFEREADRVIDELFERRDFSDVQVSDPPAFARINNGPFWGRYNRYFPVKLVVRQLANTLRIDDHSTVPADSFEQEASLNARRLVGTTQSCGRRRD